MVASKKQHDEVMKKNDDWNGDDKTSLKKKSPTSSLTKFGREEIVRLYKSGKGPCSIAVIVGVSHNVVQEVLLKLVNRPRDFGEIDFKSHTYFCD